jgi:hypothetical protein
VELDLDVAAVTAAQAIDGMRADFQRAFGRSWVGRQLSRSAWPAFRLALLQGGGIDTAAARARAAAEHRNHRTLLVARWSRTRVHRAIERAVVSAANAS